MAGNQATLLNTVTLSEFTDLVRHEWIFVRKNIKREAKQLFISENIPQGSGNTRRYDEVDIETYADYKAEGTNAQKSKVGIGYNLTGTARTFAKEIEITLEMRTYNRYAEVATYIKSLTEFCDNREDLDLTHRLTFCTSSTYTDKNGETVTVTVGDGNPLAYATHLLAFSSTTYSNRITADPAFSQTGFEAGMLLAATQIYSNFGEKRTMDFNAIVSGNDPGTVRSIRQFLESTADVDAAQAGIKNIYNGTMKHIILPNLATTAAGAYDSTKRRWWFLAATGQGLAGWQAYIAETIAPTLLTPSAQNNGADIHNLNWTYVAYCAYMIAIPSPKGLIASCPTS